MPSVVTNDGISFALQYLVGKLAVESLTLRLFTNDFTPDRTSTAGSFTEASGSGYAAIALTGGTWTVPVGDPVVEYATQTFTFTGALGDVYGYYLTRSTGGECVAACRFANAPFNVAASGDTIPVTPRFAG